MRTVANKTNIKPTIYNPSSYRLLHKTEISSDKKLAKILKRSQKARRPLEDQKNLTLDLSNEAIEKGLREEADKIYIIKFMKKGCKACAVLKPFYEKLSQTILDIKGDLRAGGVRADPKWKNSLSDFKIKNSDKFENLQLIRFNVANDVSKSIKIKDFFDFK